MNSFMNRSRYARQSPRKVQDAENAFLKNSNANPSDQKGSLRKTGSVVQDIHSKAKREEEQLR